MEEDLKKLGVDYSTLTSVYEQFEGTRHIIQYANDEYSFSLSKTFKPVVRCFGITNRCEDGKFIFFADYDKIYKKIMLQNLDNLLKRFPNCFDNFYIVRTGEEEVTEAGDVVGSYHVINFVKHTKDLINLFLQSCDVDEHFKEIPQKTAHKTHVLRISNKFYEVDGKTIKEEPKFLHVYPSHKFVLSGRECSNAHYKLFQALWGNPTKISHKFDDYKKIEFHKYLTPNKTTDKKIKIVCPQCKNKNWDYTGIQNYYSCSQCGFSRGF